jgi:hypothetical protein
MIVTYNDASLSMDAGAGDWVAGETAYVTVNDPDANKMPGSAETLSIGDEDAVIPTIKVGTPLTLATSDGFVFDGPISWLKFAKPFVAKTA